MYLHRRVVCKFSGKRCVARFSGAGEAVCLVDTCHCARCEFIVKRVAFESVVDDQSVVHVDSSDGRNGLHQSVGGITNVERGT